MSLGDGFRDSKGTGTSDSVSPLAWVKAKELPITRPWIRPGFRATISARDEARPAPMPATCTAAKLPCKWLRPI
jgi:hypothetical protein